MTYQPKTETKMEVGQMKFLSEYSDSTLDVATFTQDAFSEWRRWVENRGSIGNLQPAKRLENQFGATYDPLWKKHSKQMQVELPSMSN